jgi:uncharacterized protein DUF4260
MMIHTEGAVRGTPRLVLRGEGLALLGLATWAFTLTGHSWWLYGALFLAPDVSFAAYLAGPRVGAAVYNGVHTTLIPALLAAAGLASGNSLALALATIWAAHIGIDRALGYGLKYASDFRATHLGRIGRTAGSAAS